MRALAGASPSLPLRGISPSGGELSGPLPLTTNLLCGRLALSAPAGHLPLRGRIRTPAPRGEGWGERAAREARRLLRSARESR